MSPEENPGSMPLAGTGPETSAEPAAQPEIPPESGEIGELLTGMPEVSEVSPGQIRQGRIVKITDDEVIVDIGLKSEGAIQRSEFVAEDGEFRVQPGDVVDVLVEDYDEQEGTFTVSHRKAAVLRAWENLEKASHDGSNVKGRVVERTKGGLTVSVGGVRAFLPASQADIRPLRDLSSLVGQEIDCKVIKLNRARNNVVVSRKTALEEEASRRKAELKERLTEGAEIIGRVKNLTAYGAFVDLGGMDGLLHVTDLAWGRVSHPSEVVKVGDEIRVKVLKYDREKERISLGLKQLQPDPWEQVVSAYRPGDRATARVVSLTDYGAFCELTPGVEGLIHVSEMTWSRRAKHPSKFVSPGDRVEVAVLDVNSSQRRISLSLKQTLADPWTTLAERIAPGNVVEGRVRNLTDYGAFVEIEDGIEGLIYISDITWTRNVKHPSEVLKKGQKVRAAVLSLDANQRRVSLGLKQLQPDVWQEFFDQTPVGTVLPGKVVRLAQFGAFVELREGIEGLCHTSEMGEEHGRNGKSPLKVGTELPFRIIRVNREERKIGLSLRDVEQHEIRTSLAEASKERVEAPVEPVRTMMAEKMAEAIRAAAASGQRAIDSESQPKVAVSEEPQPVSAENAVKVQTDGSGNASTTVSGEKLESESATAPSAGQSEDASTAVPASAGEGVSATVGAEVSGTGLGAGSKAGVDGSQTVGEPANREQEAGQQIQPAESQS
jgi:small subunit ribosomal protein S1